MGIEIGKDCFLSLRARIDVQGCRISIGNNVHIASGAFILGHTGFRQVKKEDETIIEDNVRIFVNAVILPGIRVGNHSIIGAGSIVMKDVPPNVIVQGNPARVIQHLEDKA